MAIRTAIGAGRWRVVRQLLTESALLALAGGAFGLLLGYWGMRVLVLFAPSGIPLLPDMSTHLGLDLRVLGFTLLVSLATGVLFGMAPALQVSRPDLNSALRENSGRSTSSVRHVRARGLLVITEMALGLVLLIGAGLLIRSAVSMRAVQPGFETSSVLTFKTALTGVRHSTTGAVTRFARTVTERLEAVPGVRAAGSIISLPTEIGPDMSFQIEGRPASAANATGDELWRYATPHLFKALGMPLLRGRVFAETDTAQSPAVIIINEALARKYWPKQDPLGQRITIGKDIGSEFSDVTREVVGVVGNVREVGLNQEPPPVMYVPQAQLKDSLTALTGKVLPTAWVVRTSGDPLAMTAAVRREVTAVDSEQAVFEFRGMAQVLEKSMATQRFILVLLSAFAAIALLLAAIGIYGVMAYDVEQRAHEIGIRMALGAARGDVVGLVVRHGMLLAAVGVVIGLGAAFGVTRLLAAMLYGVKATDPLTFASVAAVLAAVALVATYIPARRAARVDPMSALR
jgi:predicted permease